MSLPRLSRLCGHLAIGIAIAMLFAASTVDARAQCAEFPKVKWWGNLSHDKVGSYVEKKHNGDWLQYLNKWEKQQAKLQRVYDNNSSVVFKKLEISLKEQALANYIRQVEQRIVVIRCLAAAEGFNHFSTAAGNEDKGTVKKTVK